MADSYGEITLKFFNHILWIDANRNIKTQAMNLCWMYGACVEIYEQPALALEYINERKQQKLLVLCSSKKLQDCYKQFKTLKNVYPKMIVFCGSDARARHMRLSDHYSAAVENAYYEFADLFTGITALEDKMLANPNLMNQTIQIKDREPPVIAQPVYGYSSSSQQPKSQIPFPKQPKVQEIVEAPKKPAIKKKTEDNLKLIWAYNQDEPEKLQQINNKYSKKLEEAGFPIDILETVDQARYVQDTYSNCSFILIAKQGVDLEPIQSNLNKLIATIILTTEKNEGRSQEHQNETEVNSVEELIQSLNSHIENHPK